MLLLKMAKQPTRHARHLLNCLHVNLYPPAGVELGKESYEKRLILQASQGFGFMKFPLSFPSHITLRKGLFG